MRQIVLDTETTGLETSQGHRIIEIGCVELLNRRLTGKHYHQYINPEREVDQGAYEVHGISNEFLSDKPVFAQIADEFMRFIGDAELIIHNAAFDIGFINHELLLLGHNTQDVAERCNIVDSLLLARSKHPGQKNNLDALCKRYSVDNSQRELHGALLDAEILADVYLLMTGGQTNLHLGGQDSKTDGAVTNQAEQFRSVTRRTGSGKIVHATEAECQQHNALLAIIDKASDGQCHWLRALESDQ